MITFVQTHHLILLHKSPSNPDDKKPVKFVKGQEGDDVVTIGFDPTKLIGRSFLGEPDADGTLRRRQISELVEEYEGQFKQDPTRDTSPIQICHGYHGS